MHTIHSSPKEQDTVQKKIDYDKDQQDKEKAGYIKEDRDNFRDRDRNKQDRNIERDD
jgi:hypothetical protein